MRFYVFLLYAVLFLFVNTHFVFSEDSKRIAVVEDSAGTITELSDLRSLGGKERFGVFYTNHPYYDKELIGVSTDKFDLIIPADSLISIDVKDGNALVRYQWRGREKTLKGKLVHSEIDGKSDFGEVTLAIDKLKKLTFKQPPTYNSQDSISSYTAELTLADGSKIPVANLSRYDTYYSTSGYINGGATQHDQIEDIRLLRGESLLIVDFGKIQKITFQSDNKVTIKLRNGKTATGILSNDDRAGVDGFTGIYEEGAFFIPPNLVREIVFLKTEK